MTTKNHPGVYIPPPIIYVAFFLCSFLLQNLWQLDSTLLHTTKAQIIGWVFIVFYVLFAMTAIRQFALSKNTLVTIKPATALQTTGIYAFTRNPMYLGLVFLYCGIAIFYGNWWTFLLLPLLIIVLQYYVIRREEHYLHQAFGPQYDVYKKQVRRWI